MSYPQFGKMPTAILGIMENDKHDKQRQRRLAYKGQYAGLAVAYIARLIGRNQHITKRMLRQWYLRPGNEGRESDITVFRKFLWAIQSYDEWKAFGGTIEGESVCNFCRKKLVGREADNAIDHPMYLWG